MIYRTSHETNRRFREQMKISTDDIESNDKMGLNEIIVTIFISIFLIICIILLVIKIIKL